MMYRDEDEIWPTNPAAYNQWRKVATNTQTASVAPTNAMLNAMAVLPGTGSGPRFPTQAAASTRPRSPAASGSGSPFL